MIERESTYRYAQPSVATIGENIRRLREEKGFSHQGEFAKRLGVKQSWLSDVENGRYGIPDTPSLLKIAKALGVSVERLLHDIDEEYSAQRKIAGGDGLVRVSYNTFSGDTPVEHEAEPVDLDVSDYTKNDIPVVAEGEASPTDTLNWKDGQAIPIEEWISRPKEITDQRAYAIVVRGDSMEPMFKRGMRLIISPNIPVGDGDVAYVHLKSGERLVKIVRNAAGGFVLESVNPAHGARFVKKSEVESVHRVAYARLLR